jgi:putative transcriptional regulator
VLLEKVDRNADLFYKGEVKEVRSNLLVLVAQKAQAEKRRISLRAVERDTGISYYTLNAIANGTIKEYPSEVIATLCEYFKCDIGDLLFLSYPNSTK